MLETAARRGTWAFFPDDGRQATGPGAQVGRQQFRWPASHRPARCDGRALQRLGSHRVVQQRRMHAANWPLPGGRPGPSCGILARPEPRFDGPGVSLPLIWPACCVP
eukprot:73480-Chlamydomonas_euryale.AAC.2